MFFSTQRELLDYGWNNWMSQRRSSKRRQEKAVGMKKYKENGEEENPDKGKEKGQIS